jgi:TolB-like protein
LSGRRAFERSTVADTLSAVLTAEADAAPLSAAHVPVALREVVARCLAKRPEDRLQTARELESALAAVEQRGRRRLSLRWAAVAAAMLLIAAVIATLPRSSERSAPADAPPSVIALPATVYGPNDVAYLAEAVPSTLSAQLTRVRGLEVRLPPTVMDVERVNGDLRRVADAYDADRYVLTTVTAQDDKLLLTMQLVDPSSRTIVWSGEYQGNRSDYIDLVRRAGSQVARQLSPSAAMPIESGVVTTSEAELSFRRGEYHRRRYAATQRSADFDAALSAYQRALALEPGRADAPARIAHLLVARYQSGQADAAHTASEMRMWAQRALAADARSGLAWTAVVAADGFNRTPDVFSQLRDALKAAAFDPACVDCQGVLTDVTPALSTTLTLHAERKSHAMDPLDPVLGGNFAMTLLVNDLGAEAVDVIADVRKLEPDGAWPMLQEATILAAVGRTSEAAALARKVDAAVGQGQMLEAGALVSRLVAALAAGDAAVVAAALQRVIDLMDGPGSTLWDRIWLQLTIVPALARAGRHTDALTLLDRGMAAGAVMPFDWLLRNRDLGPLRTAPRFQRAVAAAAPRYEEMLTVMDAAAAAGELPDYLLGPLREMKAFAAAHRITP